MQIDDQPASVDLVVALDYGVLILALKRDLVSGEDEMDTPGVRSTGTASPSEPVCLLSGLLIKQLRGVVPV